MFVAVTKTELKGHIPPDNCDILTLFSALNYMWSEARVEARGMDVNIPLLGGALQALRCHLRRY